MTLQPRAASASATSDALLDGLLGTAPAGVRARLAPASGGNPLFVEELVAMLVDEGVLRIDGGACALAGDLDALALPASLHALLGARLDRLEPAARATLERGAIEGEVFHRGAVVELSPPRRARSVVRRVSMRSRTRTSSARPSREFAGRGRVPLQAHPRPRRRLPRDRRRSSAPTCTSSSPTGSRRVAGERVLEYEEILGYHLEQSYRYRTELGPVDDETRALGERAARRLADGGPPGPRAAATSARRAGCSGVRPPFSRPAIQAARRSSCGSPRR